MVEVTDRGTAGVIMDALWPILGGDMLPSDMWHDIGDAVSTALAQTQAETAALRERVAALSHVAADLLQHIDWLTNGLPDLLENAGLADEEGLIGAAVDAANSARATLARAKAAAEGGA